MIFRVFRVFWHASSRAPRVTNSLSVLSKESALVEKRAISEKSHFQCVTLRDFFRSVVPTLNQCSIHHSMQNRSLYTNQEHNSWALELACQNTRGILEKSPFSESRLFEYFMSSQPRTSSLWTHNYSVDSPFCPLSNGIWTIFLKRIFEKISIEHWTRQKMHLFHQTSKLIDLHLLEEAL